METSSMMVCEMYESLKAKPSERASVSAASPRW